ISDIMTALRKNGILPEIHKGIYFRGGLADYDEKYILDRFASPPPGANAVHFGEPCKGRLAHGNG
ncbi:hypothetical protein QUG69_07590, partial [Enterobacter hormaechei]|uniref:hypothetical protein n=1 Tax=Enterobacter hormaechei TaxID=158836 RepID=UPI0025A1FC80